MYDQIYEIVALRTVKLHKQKCVRTAKFVNKNVLVSLGWSLNASLDLISWSR